MAGLSDFFMHLLSGQKLGASPGLGTGPSAAGRPTPGLVQPTAAGEAMRAQMGQLQHTGQKPKLVDKLNDNSLGSFFSSLFTKRNFPTIGQGGTPWQPTGFSGSAGGGTGTPPHSTPIPTPGGDSPPLGADGVPLPVPSFEQQFNELMFNRQHGIGLPWNWDNIGGGKGS